MQPKITHPVVSNLCPWQAYGSAHGSAHGRPEGMQTPETRVHASCLSSSPNKHEVSGRMRLACCPLCSFSVITVYTRDKCLFKFRYENVLRFLKYPRVLHLLKILFFEGGINSQPSMLVHKEVKGHLFKISLGHTVRPGYPGLRMQNTYITHVRSWITVPVSYVQNIFF